MRALLADGAEQETGAAAVAARSDDEQIAVWGGVDEDVDGVALHEPGLDLEIVGLDRRVGDDVIEQLLGRLVHIVEAGAGQRGGRAADVWVAVTPPPAPG
jgi:hypothetical protein